MLPQNLHQQKRILSENRNRLRWFIALSTLPFLGVVTAFGLVPQNNLGIASSQIAISEVMLPKASPINTAAVTYWRNERVQRGDTVDELLLRMNIDDDDASEYLRKSADASSFRKLPVGSEILAETDTNGKLIALRYLDDGESQILIENHSGSFKTRSLPARLEKRLFVRTGEIQTSLYAATDTAGMPDAAAYQLNELFSGDIDFHHDLRKGDKFTAVYEMTYSNGALLNTGRIQAAELINQGRVYRAVYFEKDAKHGDYFTPEGKSVRKAFLRSPLEYTRVSSGFSKSRFHPVLNKWRSHKGVDFAAPIGTKVKATADGVIAFVGRESGYGNVIKINHQGRHTTVYGHLSRFARNLHKGQRINQGQIIGYVGKTGLASGPHLHYEFKINGKHHNPMRVALPEARPIDEADKAAFQSVADNFVSQLNLLRNTNLARLD